MNHNSLKPTKPIAQMTDEEFDAWRGRCRECVPDMTSDDIIALIGREEFEQLKERASSIDHKKVVQMFDHAADLRANTNECVLAAAMCIASQLRDAPERIRIQAVNAFPAKLQGALDDLLLTPASDKN